MKNCIINCVVQLELNLWHLFEQNIRILLHKMMFYRVPRTVTHVQAFNAVAMLCITITTLIIILVCGIYDLQTIKI